MRIENFKQAFYAPARPTLFKVYINFPNGDNNEKDVFFCKGTQIPTKMIGIMELSYMGRKIKYPGDATYDDWTVTIYNDVGFTIRKKLEAWTELLNGAKDNISYVDPNRWTGSAKVEHLDGEKNVIKTYNIVGIWPQSNGDAIDVGFDSNDTPEEYSVTFAIDYFETETTRGGMDAGIGS